MLKNQATDTAVDFGNGDGRQVADKRGYRVRTVAEAKQITHSWLTSINLTQAVKLGLPEIDDRYHIWRVPLKRNRGERLGEVVIDAYTTEVDSEKTTRAELIESRLLRKPDPTTRSEHPNAPVIRRSPLRNTIGLGDCRSLLDDTPAGSVDLVFTSPPYFNARPEYSEYEAYEHYLEFMREVIRKTHRVLAEGRFFCDEYGAHSTEARPSQRGIEANRGSLRSAQDFSGGGVRFH